MSLRYPGLGGSGFLDLENSINLENRQIFEPMLTIEFADDIILHTNSGWEFYLSSSLVLFHIVCRNAHSPSYKHCVK